MLRLVPPAGTKLTFGELARMCARGLLPGRSSAPEVSGLLAEHIGARHVMAVGSGRAALYATLRALHTLRPERDVVAIPAYTCFSVPAAIVRAGLSIELVDVDPVTLDFDYQKLAAIGSKRLLAVLGTELFGFIGNVECMRAIARSKGGFLVDDAAQAFGASVDGLQAGRLGDVGFFSVGRGKPLFGMSGGLIVTESDEIARAIRAVVEGFPQVGRANGAGEMLRLAGYYALFHPTLYRVADSLPMLNLGATKFETDFCLARVSDISRATIREVVPRLRQSASQRLQVVAAIKDAVGSTCRFRFPEPAGACTAVYPRLPVVAQNGELRDRAVSELRKNGIGASAFYPSAVCDIPGIADHVVGELHCAAAERLSETLFTLPTHSLLTERDIGRIGRVLQSL